MSGSEVLVRGYEPGDRASLRALFDRAGADSVVDQLWGHADSEAAVYLEPYIEHEPESLLVAERDGGLVGYLTGCLDTARFPGESERMERAIRDHRLFLRPRVMGFFARGLVDVAMSRLRREEQIEDGFLDPRWPAHLHVAVQADARGSGAAEALMRRWLERLEDEGVPGCHLQTSVENLRAVRFFTRMGFVPHGPTPPVPGMRHRGERVHLLTMVQSLGGPRGGSQGRPR